MRPERHRFVETVLGRALDATCTDRRHGSDVGGEYRLRVEIVRDASGSQLSFLVEEAIRAIATSARFERRVGAERSRFLNDLAVRREVPDLDRCVIVRANAEHSPTGKRDICEEMKKRRQQEDVLCGSAFHPDYSVQWLR